MIGATGWWIRMDRPKTQPRILTLKEVLEGAARAEQRVSTWPAWKRELSAASRSDDPRQSPKKSSGDRGP